MPTPASPPPDRALASPVDAKNATASGIYVLPAFAADAILEALDADLA